MARADFEKFLKVLPLKRCVALYLVHCECRFASLCEISSSLSYSLCEGFIFLDGEWKGIILGVKKSEQQYLQKNNQIL